MSCPGCGGEAVHAPGEALGWFRHKSGCQYDLEAKIMAKRQSKRFTGATSHREITRNILDREIFLSFLNDEDAAFFEEWWNGEGAVLFQKFLDSRPTEEQ